jgi:hypothetical protein
VAAREDRPAGHGLQRLHRQFDTLTVASRSGGHRRTLGAQLAKWQVVAQHHQPGCREGSRQTCQQRRLAVGARAVRQRDGLPSGVVRLVQDAANALGFEKVLHGHWP